jgi:hypothetical protein
MRLFAPGDRVTQPQYGHGTVSKADEHHTWIEFDDHGPRMFATARCQLEPSATTAPPRPTPTRRRKNASKHA